MFSGSHFSRLGHPVVSLPTPSRGAILPQQSHSTQGSQAAKHSHRWGGEPETGRFWAREGETSNRLLHSALMFVHYLMSRLLEPECTRKHGDVEVDQRCRYILTALVGVIVEAFSLNL